MSYSAINIGMEAVSGAVLAILTMLQLSKAKKTWQDKLFSAVLITCLLLTVCDMAAWLLNGIPGRLALYGAHTANLMLNLTAGFAVFFFFFYILSYITPSERLPPEHRRPLYIVGALSVALLIMGVVNLFNGMIYSINADNHYRWGDYYLVQYVTIWVQTAIVMFYIFRWRRMLGKKDAFVFMTFGAAPALSSLLTIFVPKLMLHYPAVMLSLLLIYTTVQKDQEKRLELELSDSRTAIMISQIQPHFLYNSLSSIAVLCDEDPGEAKKAVISFSEYLRGNMNSLTITRPIPFAKELEHVKHYLTLELRRFRDRLQVSYDISVTDFSLPALTLQPIVENAVRHGIQKQRKGGTVTISTREKSDGFVIAVTDDGAGFDPADAKRGIGIANVRERISALCGGTLTIESAPGTGTTATIWIPKQGREQP